MLDTPRSILAKFGQSVTARMMRIEPLHLSGHRPFSYEDRWICTETVTEILAVDLQLESANEWLVRNRPCSRCDICFYAQKANEYDAHILGIEAGEALFVMERTTWIGARPITSVRAVTTPGYQLLAQI